MEGFLVFLPLDGVSFTIDVYPWTWIREVSVDFVSLDIGDPSFFDVRVLMNINVQHLRNLVSRRTVRRNTSMVELLLCKLVRNIDPLAVSFLLDFLKNFVPLMWTMHLR